MPITYEHRVPASTLGGLALAAGQEQYEAKRGLEDRERSMQLAQMAQQQQMQSQRLAYDAASTQYRTMADYNKFVAGAQLDAQQRGQDVQNRQMLAVHQDVLARGRQEAARDHAIKVGGQENAFQAWDDFVSATLPGLDQEGKNILNTYSGKVRSARANQNFNPTQQASVASQVLDEVQGLNLAQNHAVEQMYEPGKTYNGPDGMSFVVGEDGKQTVIGRHYDGLIKPDDMPDADWGRSGKNDAWMDKHTIYETRDDDGKRVRHFISNGEWQNIEDEDEVYQAQELSKLQDKIKLEDQDTMDAYEKRYDTAYDREMDRLEDISPLRDEYPDVSLRRTAYEARRKSVMEYLRGDGTPENPGIMPPPKPRSQPAPADEPAPIAEPELAVQQPTPDEVELAEAAANDPGPQPRRPTFSLEDVGGVRQVTPFNVNPPPPDETMIAAGEYWNSPERPLPGAEIAAGYETQVEHRKLTPEELAGIADAQGQRAQGLADAQGRRARKQIENLGLSTSDPTIQKASAEAAKIISRVMAERRKLTPEEEARIEVLTAQINEARSVTERALEEGRSVSDAPFGPGWDETVKERQRQKEAGEFIIPEEERAANRERIIKRDMEQWWEKGEGTKYGWARAGNPLLTSENPRYDASKLRGGLEVYPGAKKATDSGQFGYRIQQAHNEKRMKQEGVVWLKEEGEEPDRPVEGSAPQAKTIDLSKEFSNTLEEIRMEHLDPTQRGEQGLLIEGVAGALGQKLDKLQHIIKSTNLKRDPRARKILDTKLPDLQNYDVENFQIWIDDAGGMLRDFIKAQGAGGRS